MSLACSLAGSGVIHNTHACCDTSLYRNQAVGNIDGCLLYTPVHLPDSAIGVPPKEDDVELDIWTEQIA